MREDIALAYRKDKEWQAQSVLLPYKKMCSRHKVSIRPSYPTKNYQKKQRKLSLPQNNKKKSYLKFIGVVLVGGIMLTALYYHGYQVSFY